MSHREFLREEIIEWNNQFPLDRIYRKKYNIPYGSEAHRQLSQIDIYIDWLEGQVYEEFQESMQQRKKDEEDLKKGIWLKKQEYTISDDEALDLFDNIDITEF